MATTLSKIGCTFGSILGDGEELADTYRLVVMDASPFGALQVGIAASTNPLPGILGVIKPDSTYGTCGISRLTRFRTGGILAQQAACGLFVNV